MKCFKKKDIVFDWFENLFLYYNRETNYTL